jgi:hypothetical protein
MPDYGRRHEFVRFTTGLTRQPDIRLNILVDLSPPVHFSQDTLVLPRDGGGEATQTVFVSVRKDLDPTHLEIKGQPDGLRVAKEPVNERMFKLTVGWTGNELVGAAVLFEVDDEIVRLPVELGPAVAAVRR